LNSICPYCRTEVGEAESERQDCPGCATPHHADCFAENGGCTVFGCSHAPTGEAKVTVSGSELAGQPAPGSPRVPRPGISLGAGFTTFRAPAIEAARSVPEVPTAGTASSVPPPPPAAAGTGVAPPPQASVYAPSQLANFYQPPQPKTRVLFVLLGIFLGVFGVHNFYAGYVKKGTIQLCLTVLTCFYGGLLSWPWAIVEVCTINKDAEGTQFV
jgi:TM2 domain-containing membrane protein YozV